MDEKERQAENERHEKSNADAYGFLESMGISMSHHNLGFVRPPWKEDNEIHGYKYRIMMHRTTDGDLKGFMFPFWDSYHNARELGLRTVDVHGVLDCIVCEYRTPETFEEFCSEFGYDTESRSARKTWIQANRFTQKLRAFFTDEEIEKIEEWCQ